MAERKSFTKRREGAERFVAAGVAFAFVGAVTWLWSAATNRDTTLAVAFVIVGLSFAGGAASIRAYRKHDRADS